MQPKVSVILYCRNCVADLAKAVSYVLDAGLDEIELVAIDDGSMDATASALAELSLEHPDTLRVVSHINATGMAGAISDATHAARAPWCCVATPCDEVRPAELLALALEAEATGADMATGKFINDVSPRSEEPAVPVLNVVTPDDGEIEGSDIAKAIYLEGAASEGFEGKVFATKLLQHSASSLKFEATTSAQDIAVCAVAAFKSEKFLCSAKHTVLVKGTGNTPYLSDLAEVAHTASARYAAEAIMAWLARNNQWEEQSPVWSAIAHKLAKKSLDTVLARVEKRDWPQAADMVLQAWGGAILGACLREYDEIHSVMAIMVLSCASSLMCSSRRPRSVACLVRSVADVFALEALLPELSTKGVSIALLADEGVELDESTEVAQTLPAQDGNARIRALDDALRTLEIDTLVTFETPVDYDDLESNAIDLLIARARDVATVTVMSKQMAVFKSWEALAATAALSVVCVIEEGAAGWAVAKALGARTCKASSLISQLTLGSIHDVCLDEKFDAAMLLHAANQNAQATKWIHAQEIEALEAKIAETEEAMKAQKERLEMELDEVQAELDQSKAKGFRFGRPKK